ncbi:hypothetical protein HanPI659440_Chr12g0466821 [Helianthus annuus]|uniref:Uncharacterized protein n=1 Tax=Helianthus annuus TaxID=4232 RepID=A0A9K3HHV6_HELAN|nr:hypothetical protein HanXRQr2_Chr12g0549081 [Helianthus annuus]KAJ0489963.1 hypothetical protein HanHA300_Chr12g0449951 [Helianthus annuus]KAJ0494005.1 hypothetical protein HanIR_Chr12g0592481 [Helianthus annuus]KAJ0675549.1 hypothetical protein HanLR1_Chr12g0452421 [Helianthus annuus]KAJ0678829.1 hypothetical protein HanOQP8_Chr12g0452321 [Helianthus annuus]
MEENLVDMRSIASAKDITFSKLEKDKNVLEEQLHIAEVGTHEAVMVATDEAQVCAA